MTNNLQPLDILITSKSTIKESMPKNILFFIIGAYLLTTSIYKYISAGSTKYLLTSILLGIAALVVIRFRKLIYIAKEGIVTETHTWFTHHRELLEWKDVKSVTIMERNGALVVFAEKDTFGWKARFEKSQHDELRSILSKYLKDKEIKEIRV
ncbi:MAG: hypothetical protein RR272_02900 [Synergistaceae bacterium]